MQVIRKIKVMSSKELQFKNGNPGAVKYGNFINYYKFNPPANRITLLPTNIWPLVNNTRNSIETTQKTFLALDIGCNAGNLTHELMCFLEKHLPQDTKLQILAIDIDPVLIQRANENFHSENIQFECSDCIKDEFKTLTQKFLQTYDKTRFDTIFCFSTTMWIHLNHGDDGLKQFLLDICELCEMFVVEPQPWKCYATAVKRMRGIIDFPHFKTLNMRFDIVNNIATYLTSSANMYKVFESKETEWKRKILCFKNVF